MKIIEDKINYYSQYDTPESKGAVIALKEVLEEIGTDNSKLCKAFQDKFGVKPVKVSEDIYSLRGYKVTKEQIRLEVEKNLNNFIIEHFYGSKYLFHSDVTPNRLKGLIRTFGMKRKNKGLNNFINFCQLEFNTKINVVMKYSSMTKKQSK